MKQITLIMILLLSIMSCKKDCPEPDTGNNNEDTSGTREYIVNAKIVNGTTGNALYTESKVYLEVERKYGLGFIERERLGSTYMEADGSMEIAYKHSAMGDKYGARVRLYSDAFTSGYYLPNNQDVDTTIYRSSKGTVVLKLMDQSPGNKIYFAYRVDKDSLISDSSDINESRFINIRSTMPGFGIYYDSLPLDIREDPSWGDVVYGNPETASVNMRGDPYTDTLTIEY